MAQKVREAADHTDAHDSATDIAIADGDPVSIGLLLPVVQKVR